MKIAVYFCDCGTNISERIDAGAVAALGDAEGFAFLKRHEFLCSEEGKQFLAEDLAAERPDRVVIAACSPREHQGTFMRVMEQADLNPFLMQLANIREHVAWVTPDAAEATAKASRLIRAALERVRLHEPLEAVRLTARAEVLVIGAGPAGLKAALSLVEAGRKVTVVERTPVLGGLPVLFEEVFPKMECGPCMLEPMLGEVLHGPHAESIEVLTQAEVTDVAGYYGNFTVQIRQAPRFVDLKSCIGCGMCVEPCPATAPNPFNSGLNTRKAIDYTYAGALPNAPYLDPNVCLRWQSQECRACLDACPVEGAVDFSQAERVLERNVGALVVATGAGLYGLDNLPALGHGTVPGVFTSMEFERIAASNGPTGGEIRSPGGAPPESVAIVHCVGSLDAEHRPYCSRVCCSAAMKFDRLIAHKLPGVKVHHLYRELALPGKDDFELYREASANTDAAFTRYSGLGEIEVVERDGAKVVRFRDAQGEEHSIRANMVVLCPAVVPGAGAAALAETLGITRDRHGFFEELHCRTDSARSKLKGVHLAGACQSPSDIQESMRQGMAAAGYVLSGLAEGKELTIDPVVAEVDRDRCSGCRICRTVCPYKAISHTDGKAAVSGLLCQGCGTCVSACPAAAIRGLHFTNQQIFAEIEAILR